MPSASHRANRQEASSDVGRRIKHQVRPRFSVSQAHVP